MKRFCTNLIATIVVWLRVREIRIIGAENIPPKETGYILVCNHVSYFDPALIWKVVNRPARWWMKTDILFWLVDSIFVALAKPLLGIIPINRKKRSKKRSRRPIDDSLPMLESGEVIAIFPAGTRKSDKMVFAGAIELAMESGAPILPVAVIGTRGLANPFEFIIQRGRAGVTVVIGEPYGLSRNGQPKNRQRLDELRNIESKIGALITLAS